MNDFFASILELGGQLYFGTFSDDLFDLNMYPWIGWSCILVCLLVAILYYYVFDSPKYIKVKHWLILAVVNALVLAAGISLYISNVFNFDGLEYFFSDYLNFALVLFFFNVLLFFLFSISIKWWSPNRRRTPF